MAKEAIDKGKNIIIETVFNDDSFINLVDQGRNANYQTSLVVLFLDSVQQSNDRVALRGMQQSGITISGSNVKINFNESFKNIATYFFYFDRSDFIYTGEGDVNQLVMSFHKGELLSYVSNELNYPQKFASFSFQKDRLNDAAYKIISANKDFNNTGDLGQPEKFKLK